MLRTRRRAVHDSGEEIWERVLAAADEGATAEEARGDLTEAQFEAGKAWIREFKCQNEGMCFVLFRGRYYITRDDADMCVNNITNSLRYANNSVVRVRKAALDQLPPEIQQTARVALLKKEIVNLLKSLKPSSDAGFGVETAVATEERKTQEKDTSNGPAMPKKIQT